MPFLLSIVIVLIVAGLLLWVCGQLPLDPTILRIIRVVVVVFVVLYLLYAIVPMIGGGPYFPLYPRR